MHACLFLTLISIFLSFSQINYEASLPNISPVLPEAANLGQYGYTPLNLSTGRLNYSIPLLNIKAGSIGSPLPLSYSYGSFMPEATPSMTGLGWTAFLGGAILLKKLNSKKSHRYE